MSATFHFKQFTIYQSANAMKVTTDACVLGSITADFLSNQPSSCCRIADIGAGTGILSCMIQQKNPHLYIEAIEIEQAFCEEMKRNITTCMFPVNIRVYPNALQQYIPPLAYDCILSNPPFFNNQTYSANALRKQVRHDTTLSYKDILIFAEQYLKIGGWLILLLPYHIADVCTSLSRQYGLYLYRRINIKSSIKKPYIRSILFLQFSLSSITPQVEQFIYTNIKNTYTDEFKTLLKPYYLFL